uniref:Leucine zipper transcription factor-like protein 1 n=1 Tax=Seriola lalandi dorsalis TaxID=1841481 RepID=A0A3B4WDS1_SERLL
MRFARSKRVLRLKTIDSCFEELKDSRLVEETFTVDEVREMLDGLQAVVRGEVEMELINTAHTNVLLLRQLFSQAEKFYLRLQSDISELENRYGALYVNETMSLFLRIICIPYYIYIFFKFFFFCHCKDTVLNDSC